jgi:hypothetical protein
MKDLKLVTKNRIKTMKEVKTEYLKTILRKVKGDTKAAALVSGLSERTVRDFKKGLNQ